MDLSGEWLNAQCSTLGSALIEPSLVPKIMAETSERDYNGPCRVIYAAMRKLFLAGEDADVVSVANILGPDLRQYMIQLMEITPTAANIDRYITLCREQARTNAIRDIAQQILEADNHEAMRKLLEDANGLMVDKPSVKIITMEDAITSFYDRHTKEVEYLNWPIQNLSEHIYAELGDLIILGGYPSSGKSAFALQCAWHWAKRYKVGFFSLETSDKKLFDRQMAAVAGLRMSDIKRNTIDQDGWDRMAAMSTDIMARNLELIPAAGMSPADVRSLTIQRGYQIIFVDYLQLLQGNGENRTAQVTSISIALHTLAQSLGVTVVALSQLARQGQDRLRPDMSQLRESGQIEQDADVIMILSLENKNSRTGNRVLSTVKNKEGICSDILLAFDGMHQTFAEIKNPNATLSKLVADGKKIRRRAAQDAARWPEQYTLLDDNTPLPF